MLRRVLAWADASAAGAPSPEPALEGVRWQQQVWLSCAAARDQPSEKGSQVIATACAATAVLILDGVPPARLARMPPSAIAARAARVLGLRDATEVPLVFGAAVTRWQLSLASVALARGCPVTLESVTAPRPEASDIGPRVGRGTAPDSLPVPDTVPDSGQPDDVPAPPGIPDAVPA
jgi:hypothetical protein